ncbi:hypothetical protein F5B22DRAFT_546414 [Xylaria bambusicola]|uniref:uncharacterized protein n=1 Tax=Xylaria bambusicola TaxID=326684 RepID=UPI002007DFB7|nr:uncharacterized protein F5B22DRAFT_546414 [Xylaria bambusicola]KAI0521673.1 hypothetical protein F5B22DRAFT_546414 [Xylaria bambusicola]
MTATFTPPLAALTTVFTPPCPTTWLLTTTKVPSQFPPFPTTAAPSCDPPSWDEYIGERGFEYYSPAICPDGFYVGPSCIITNPRTQQGFPEIQGGETAAYCIPTGHTCTSDTSDFRGGVWGVSRTASESGAQVTVGPAIQIRWREEDLENLETDPLDPGPKTTTTPSPTVPDTLINVPAPTTTELPPSTSTSSSSTTPPPPSTKTSSSSTTSTQEPRTTLSRQTRETLGSSTSSSSSIPPLLISTEESQPSTTQETSPSSSSVSPSDPPNASPQREGGGTTIGNTSSNFTVAAIVLSAVLITIIIAYTSYSILYRYRRYRAGETESFFLFEIKTWVGTRARAVKRKILREKDIYSVDEKAGDGRDRRKKWKLPDAELGTEGPLPELGDEKPFGTMENPAELPSVDRSSWRSRMSRILSPNRATVGSKPSV